MAKKPSAKPKKKATRRAGAAPKSTRSAGATRRKREREEKYEQPGAPWWKKHLPE